MTDKPTTDLQTLDDVRAFVARTAQTLDPDSRYISEFLAVVDAAPDIDALEAAITASSRGQRHAGADVFARMSLRNKVLSNLITAETALFRFAEGELEALSTLPARAENDPVRVLIVPCSHGEEAFTVAAHFLRLATRFSIRAFDIQPALVEEARTGRLTFGYPTEYLSTPGYVSESVLEHIEFDRGDAFALPLPEDATFDVVLCRNFIGYFVPDRASELVDALARRLAPGGLLFLDSFCSAKMPLLLDTLARRDVTRLGAHPVFARR